MSIRPRHDDRQDGNFLHGLLPGVHLLLTTEDAAELEEKIKEDLRQAVLAERARIVRIIREEPWEYIDDDYYHTYDSEQSIKNLVARIEA